MAKNRTMAQKNQKVKKCDAEKRRERKLNHMAVQQLDPKQNAYRLNINDVVSLCLYSWENMYAEI